MSAPVRRRTGGRERIDHEKEETKRLRGFSFIGFGTGSNEAGDFQDAKMLQQ